MLIKTSAKRYYFWPHRDVSINHSRGEKAALENSQKMMIEARKESSMQKRISLAKSALATSALCADAHNLLAEYQAKDREEAEKLYLKGIRVSGLALHMEMRCNSDPELWNDTILQHFLRAAHGLARVFRDVGSYGEDVTLWHPTLCVDDNDELEVVRLFVPILIRRNWLEEAETLMELFSDDSSARMLYSRALILFKKHGVSDIANDALWKAICQNIHVFEMLKGEQKLTTRAHEFYLFGSMEEAEDYLMFALPDWTELQETINWSMNFER